MCQADRGVGARLGREVGMTKRVDTQAGVWEALLGEESEPLPSAEAVASAAVLEVDAGAAGSALGAGSAEGSDTAVALGGQCEEDEGAEDEGDEGGE